MTKQPVVGTIIIGILVTLMGVWALALALDLEVVQDIKPTHLLIGTLLVGALVLILAALLPRSADKTEVVQFSPVSVELAQAGITAKKDPIVADLRWIDPTTPITVPILTPSTATVLVDPAGLAIRTASPNVDIGTDLGITWAAQHGTQNVYIGPGLTDPSQARLTVDIAAATVKVRSR